jgi:hypothetical protein
MALGDEKSDSLVDDFEPYEDQKLQSHVKVHALTDRMACNCSEAQAAGLSGQAVGNSLVAEELFLH